MSRPEQPFITAVEARLKQMRREQIDLLGDTSGKSFVGFETIVVPAEQPFDLLTAEGIAAEKRLAGPAETQVNITVQELPAAYLFKTREGGRGVLEVVRFSTNLESMDFRYKLVRARREFEPVTTLILPSAAGSRRFLNLTDGKSYSEIPAKDPVAYLENDPKDGWRLIIEGIYNYHAETEKGAKLWESLSAEEIAQPAGLAAAPFERKGFYRVRSQDLPSVVLIPQWGLLRIAEFDDRTTTLVIQHKRVAAGSQADAGKPADSEKRRTSRNQSAEALERLQQAEAELGRTAKLYATKQVTEEKLDKAKLDVEISTAELKGDDGEAARLRLRKAEASLEQLTKLHADKLASSEALEEARLNVELQRAALRGDDLEFARIKEQLRQNSDRRSVVEK